HHAVGGRARAPPAPGGAGGRRGGDPGCGAGGGGPGGGGAPGRGALPRGRGPRARPGPGPAAHQGPGPRGRGARAAAGRPGEERRGQDRQADDRRPGDQGSDLMDLQLAGRVAIVTGASRGLGRAAAEALVAEGALVLAAARSTADLEKLRAEAPERIAVATVD